MIQTVGIVGNGAFGSLLRELINRFAPNVSVRVCSSRAEPDGNIFFTLEEVATCDAVVLTVPIAAFEATLARVLPYLGTESVIVDVATVKTHTAEVLRRLAPERRWIATHPMWGPESYKKKNGDVRGFRIVLAEHTLADAEVSTLQAILSSLGFTILRMSAESHDKHLAETLFLTHFIGQIVTRARFDRTPIDTVSFGFLMDAVESVRHDTALFRDVYRFNPYCRDVLERFGIAESEVRRMLD